MTRGFSLSSAVVAVLALFVGGLVAALPAQATARPIGDLFYVRQDTATHRMTVHGWAADPAHRATSVLVRVYVDGTMRARLMADDSSPKLNRYEHLQGRHDFTVGINLARTAKRVVVTSRGVNAPSTAIASSSVQAVRSDPGLRIVAVAKRYVGRARYVDGGASPRTGFDCSGYTQYAYAVAHVRRLTHNAEGQRRSVGMRRISARSARPGDLVFYLSGGSAYHVAIYAGHHMQYSAATPRDGIRYQPIWSSAVVFGTDWH